MIPHLSPELLLLIADHFERPIPLSQVSRPSIGKAIKADNSALVNMMKSSKVSLMESNRDYLRS